jgi:putative transposase
MTLVDQLRDRFAVEPILRVINVPVSTYYGWCQQARQPCQRARVDAQLAEEITAIHQRSGATYGSRACTRRYAGAASGWAASGWSG